MKRSPLRSRPRRRDTDRAAAYRWFYTVTHGARCVVCGRTDRLQGHHVVSQQALRHDFPFGVRWDPIVLRRVAVAGGEETGSWPSFRTLQELLWDPHNGIALCARCHERHTNAIERVPRSALPTAAIAFAELLGLQHRVESPFYP